MTAASVRSQRSLTIPLSASLLLHLAVAAAFLLVKTGAPRVPMSQVYAIEVVSAPRSDVLGPGVVNPAKAAPDKPAPARPREVKPKQTVATKRAPQSKTVKATTSTPQESKTSAKPEQPKAGGTVEGGKGVDVTSVKFEGREFPYPWYLENIVNQIRRFFVWDGSTNYRADVQFFIKRDGSAADIRIVPAGTSASYEFRFAATGAVDKASKIRAFGPLPDDFPDEVLSVIFSFDKRIIK